MKNMTLLMVLILIASAAVPAGAIVNFRNTSYAKVFDQAHSENKELLFFFVKDTCKVCDEFKKSIIDNQDIDRYLQENYLSIEINVSRSEGSVINRIWQIEKFPTVLFLDDKKNIVNRIEDNCSPEKFLELAKKSVAPFEKFSFGNDDYSIKIDEARLKLRQVSSSIGDDSLIYRGMMLKNIVASLLDIDVNLIASNNDQMVATQLFVTFANKAGSRINPPKITLEELSKLYGFTIEKIKKEQEIWEITVANREKLMKYVSAEFSTTNTFSTNQTEIIIKNSTWEQIASLFTNSYSRYFADKTGMDTRFDMTLSRGDFETLKSALSADYGIALKKITKELEFTNIVFAKSK